VLTAARAGVEPMSATGLLLVAILLSAGSQQTGNSVQEYAVERLCGKLERAWLVPIKGSANSFEQKTKSLRNIPLRLYRRGENVSCCGGLPIVTKTETGHRGQFKLKGVAPGLYWFVVVVEGQEYKLPIRYEPAKGSNTLCSDLFIQITGSGKFQFARKVTVD
jgi:hypothetical protein